MPGGSSSTSLSGSITSSTCTDSSSNRRRQLGENEHLVTQATSKCSGHQSFSVEELVKEELREEMKGALRASMREGIFEGVREAIRATMVQPMEEIETRVLKSVSSCDERYVQLLGNQGSLLDEMNNLINSLPRGS